MRIAHRIKELHELPHGLAHIPSILKVKNWYAQSFKDLTGFPAPRLPESIQRQLATLSMSEDPVEARPNPSLQGDDLFAESEPKSHLDSTGALVRRTPVLAQRDYARLSEINWPPEVEDYNEQFTRCLERIKRRHDGVVTTLAQGVLEYTRATANRKEKKADVQRFLDRFYMSRIGIRFLIGQQIALGRSIAAPKGGALERIAGAFEGTKPEGQYVGIICTDANIGKLAHEAIENARFVCEEHYDLFSAPPVQLVCPHDLTFMYVSSHLNHMLFELLKNSLRAVVERYGSDCDDYPPIKVIVVEGQEDITIKISDEGGGIPRSEVPMAWTYMYTTAQPEDLDPDFQSSDFQAPMAGFGYGLPLARLYARYFGGDLNLISMESYGTDVYLHLNRLSSSSEPLP